MNASAPHTPTAPQRPEPLPSGTGALGLFWLLMSLGMLFVATLVAFWVVRGGMELADLDPRPSAMPLGVWVGTVILIALSWVSEKAARAGNQTADPLLRRLVQTAFWGSIAFLAVQGWNWSDLHNAGFAMDSGLYSFTFHVLTGLHGAHVIGGVVYQASALKALPSRDRLRSAATYWHFLFVTWVLIVGTVAGTASESGPVIVGTAGAYLGWTCLGAGIICWLLTVRLIFQKDGPVFGVLALFPLFSVVFGWVRFQEHDNLRVMIAWQLCIALGMLGWILSAAMPTGA